MLSLKPKKKILVDSQNDYHSVDHWAIVYLG